MPNNDLDNFKEEFKEGFLNGNKKGKTSEAYKAGVDARLGGLEFYFINLGAFLAKLLVNKKSN